MKYETLKVEKKMLFDESNNIGEYELMRSIGKSPVRVDAKIR
jgi:hypothetical protein